MIPESGYRFSDKIMLKSKGVIPGRAKREPGISQDNI
jgi:hypothetical protein